MATKFREPSRQHCNEDVMHYSSVPWFGVKPKRTHVWSGGCYSGARGFFLVRSCGPESTKPVPKIDTSMVRNLDSLLVLQFWDNGH